MKISIYTNEDEVEWTVSSHWEICPRCEGHATDRGASVECDGGGFTASEWAEQDDDFKDDYLSGRYDRPCQACKGLGRVEVPNLDDLEPEARAAYDRQLEDDADYEALCAAERRMGC